MIRLSLKAAKEGFFDRKAVMNGVDRATRKVFSKFGAFVRTRSKTSIRKRKGSAPPGKPPYSHKGQLKRLIFFAFDKDRQSVVIGPTLIDRPTGAPETLEHGDTVRLTVSEPIRKSTRPTTPAQRAAYRRLIQERRITPPTRRKVTKQVTYKPRPYMQPAFDAELPGLPALWKDSIRP